ncbi:MAG: hypothetical protein OEV87_04165 [Phycisphaerae bacterium]|nr:hypothetical protein [Phycisphaerae bacterium]
MRAITIGQVLDHVEAFEDLLSTFYETFSRESSHEGVRLLTEYMSRHSHHMRDLLSKLPEEKVSHFLKVPISYQPHIPDCHCFERIEITPETEAAEVLDAAVLLDECLMQLYRQVVRQPVEEQIRELFEELILIVEQDEIQIKKIKAMNYF